jgi:hypothetical protein
MKRKFKYIIFSFLFVFLTGCSEWLVIKPESEIILDEYWRSASDVNAVIASCYRRLTEADIITRMIIWGELRSDNITTGSGLSGNDNVLGSMSDVKRILEGEITSYNSFVSWGGFYSVINYCNTILEYAPHVTQRDRNFTQADLLRTQAEVLAIRSLAYFYLIRTFKDVPWIEDASINDTQDYDQPQTSEEQIIDNIIRDLLIARNSVPDSYGRTDYDKGRVTQSMVNALLADVYLWKEDYQQAIDACDLVLSNPKLRLERGSYVFSRNFYIGNSAESIFELQFDDHGIVNEPVKRFYGTYSKPTGFLALPIVLSHNPYALENPTGDASPFNYKITSTVIESVEDVRAKDSYLFQGGVACIFKYAGAIREENVTHTGSLYEYRNNTSNWIIYRLPDVMLMKAEALVQLETPESFRQAIDLVNETYLRSNEGADSLQLANYSGKAELEKLVLRERQREFLFEGKRWFDLLRLARRQGSTGDLNAFVDKKASGMSVSLSVPVLDALYLPVSNGELRANPRLVQNPYYKEATSSTK